MQECTGGCGGTGVTEAQKSTLEAQEFSWGHRIAQGILKSLDDMEVTQVNLETRGIQVAFGVIRNTLEALDNTDFIRAHWRHEGLQVHTWNRQTAQDALGDKWTHRGNLKLLDDT